MKPRTSMGHRTNSSLCVGFMVVSHSHGTIQVITCNTNAGQDLENRAARSSDTHTDEWDEKKSRFRREEYFRVGKDA